MCFSLEKYLFKALADFWIAPLGVSLSHYKNSFYILGINISHILFAFTHLGSHHFVGLLGSFGIQKMDILI